MGDYYPVPPVLNSSSSAEVIAVVTAQDRQQGPILTYSGFDGNIHYRFNGDWYQSFARDVRVSVPQQDMTVPHVYNIVSDSDFRLRRNDADLLNVSDGSFSTGTVRGPLLGRTNNQYLYGHIGELVIYESSLSSADRRAEHDRIAGKLGITL